MNRPTVVVIGLDCLAPQLVFDRWRDQLPTFQRLMSEGCWGRLRSSDPPITVPAWSCMMSGYNAGQLGIYGFRHRVTGTYYDRYFARGDRVKLPRVWDHLGQAGKTAGLVGVPDTYPPRPINGYSVSGFLAPNTDGPYTYPDSLRDEVEDTIGKYILDVEDFRSDSPDRILAEIQEMTQRRFQLFRHFVRNRCADFMMLCEIGPDRVHHAFWRHCDPTHRLYVAGNRYENVILDYYRYLDSELAETLALLDDSTDVFVVSDHGARAMEGGFCINSWLMQRGLLTLREPPSGVEKFEETKVDWSRTRAWAWGGYYGRIFVNLEGREPEGQVPRDQYESFLRELTDELTRIVGPDGRPLGNRVLRARDLVESGEPAGDYPDLMVYFGELRWRAIGAVGYSDVFTYENDTGPDDANHDFDGIFIHRGARRAKQGGSELAGLRLVDVAPTILQLFGLAAPGDAVGRPISLS